jgi:hypothetical protein
MGAKIAKYSMKRGFLMKKLLVLIACMGMVISFSGCKGVVQMLNDRNSANAGDDAEVTEVSDKNEGDCSIDLLGAYSFNDLSGDYIVLEFDFKNNSSENKKPCEAYTYSAFQNGIEMEQNNSWTCPKDNISFATFGSYIQPGYSATVYLGFKADQLGSTIDVECTPVDGGESIKKTISVSSAYYEKATESTTSAPVTQVVVTPAPAPAQTYNDYGNGGYVCMGRTMSEASALMTSAEKQIISSGASQELINEQYAKHGYCFQKSYWHNYFYGYDH